MRQTYQLEVIDNPKERMSSRHNGQMMSIRAHMDWTQTQGLYKFKLDVAPLLKGEVVTGSHI